ncbi:hypothetical protein ACFX15_006090 [Malus domestica]
MLLEKAREEIYRVIGNKQLVGEPDVPNLPYLQAIIKETFRLHPPASLVTRKTVQKRDPKIWDCPLDFWPERFLQQGTDNQVNSVDVRGQHFQLLPFGSGRRVCPGVNLTMKMLPGVLAAMIQCFDWQLSSKPIAAWKNKLCNSAETIGASQSKRPSVLGEYIISTKESQIPPSPQEPEA